MQLANNTLTHAHTQCKQTSTHVRSPPLHVLPQPASIPQLQTLDTLPLDMLPLTTIVPLPTIQGTFITAMCMTPDPVNLLFAACLDGNLRLYSDKLRLRSCMPWSNGVVRDVVYNPARDEIVTAGSQGIRVWVCEMDHEAYRSDKDIDPYSIPRTKDGKVLPWGYGKYQNTRMRLQLRWVWV